MIQRRFAIDVRRTGRGSRPWASPPNFTTPLHVAANKCMSSLVRGAVTMILSASGYPMQSSLKKLCLGHDPPVELNYTVFTGQEQAITCLLECAEDDDQRRRMLSSLTIAKYYPIHCVAIGDTKTPADIEKRTAAFSTLFDWHVRLGLEKLMVCNEFSC